MLETYGGYKPADVMIRPNEMRCSGSVLSPQQLQCVLMLVAIVTTVALRAMARNVLDVYANRTILIPKSAY